MAARPRKRQDQKLLKDPFALINSLEDALLLVDRRTVVTFVNKTGEEFLGRGQREIVGKRISEVFPKERTIAKLVRKAVQEPRSFSAKDVEVRVNGGVRADFRISPVFLENRHDGALLSIRGNVSIVEKEDPSFDSLVFLIGSIAHEIKNPLGGIKGAAQLLKGRLREPRKKAEDGESAEYLDLIIRETDRLNGVLQGYLTMSRRPALHPVNVHEVIEKAVSIMNPSGKGGKIAVTRQYDPSLPKVLGDEGKLLQVFVNIIKNAIEAMPRGGSLGFTTKPSDEYVLQAGQTKRWAVVSVADTGRGIPKAELLKVFLPFYTRKKRGTGLGLALTKKIIRDHNGFIRVESPAPGGRGTVFHLYIPFASE